MGNQSDYLAVDGLIMFHGCGSALGWVISWIKIVHLGGVNSVGLGR